MPFNGRTIGKIHPAMKKLRQMMANQNSGKTPVITENESPNDGVEELSHDNNNIDCFKPPNVASAASTPSGTDYDSQQTDTSPQPSSLESTMHETVNSQGNVATDTHTSSQTVNGLLPSSSSLSSDAAVIERSRRTGCTEDRFNAEGFSVASVNDVVLRSLPTRGARQAMSEFMLTSPRSRSYTVQDAKEQAHIRLECELVKAQTELKLKDEECEKLSKVRDQMGLELEDLTASLFEEANKMVQDAHLKRATAEKQLNEAKQQIEVLQAELTVFKSLVLTSTPNTPNRHLHPQIDVSPTKKKELKPFWKGHRRSTSHHDFTHESRREAEIRQQEDKPNEIDHSSYVQFISWRENVSLDHTYEFLSRIMDEDIIPCLNFSNQKLSKAVRDGIETNSLMIEPITTTCTVQQKCCLTDSPKSCNYKIKLDAESEWLPISQHCRNRIAAVCDFYTYLRYILQGLVKSEDIDIYNEVVRLRRQMALSRLGYS